MKNVLIKDIPDSISEQDVLDWVSVLVERKLMRGVEEIPAVISAKSNARADLDTFKNSNNVTGR